MSTGKTSNQLDVFMKKFNMDLKISYSDHIANERICSVAERQMGFTGHILRTPYDRHAESFKKVSNGWKTKKKKTTINLQQYSTLK